MHEVYDLGLILRELRVKAGMSQKELGERINRDKGIISRYESNLQTPSFEIIRDLSGIFGVSVSYLAGEKPDNAVNTIGLNNEQMSILTDMAELFRGGRQENLSSQQLALIGRIAVAFALPRSSR